MITSITDFELEMRTTGISIHRDVVPSTLIKKLRVDIPKRQEICRMEQIKNGLASGMEGAAHHVVGGEDSLAEFLEGFYLHELIHSYFDGPYILNSYGALNNLPNARNVYKHGHNFHRDVRTYSSSFRLMLNMLVMVDDFTPENGATKVVPGSHHVAARPSDEYLEKHAVRATGTAGTILLFDSNIWHSAAPNYTDAPRMALTLTFTRPFFKQQMDYPRMLGEAYARTEEMRQLLGYNARVPVDYSEWYQPPELRMYKPGQG